MCLFLDLFKIFVVNRTNQIMAMTTGPKYEIENPQISSLEFTLIEIVALNWYFIIFHIVFD